MAKDSNTYGPMITASIEKYLGKGKKISDATPEKAEMISLIVDEIKEDIMPLLNT